MAVKMEIIVHRWGVQGTWRKKSLVWLLLFLALWSWWEFILTISLLCWHFPSSSFSSFILNSCWPSPAPPKNVWILIRKKHQPWNVFCTTACLHHLSVILAQQRPSVGVACILKSHTNVFGKLGAEASRRYKGDTPTLWTHDVFNKLCLLSQKACRALWIHNFK